MNSFKSFFPVNLSTEWENPNNFHIESTLLDWLIDPSSLTARLKKHCHQFRVEVLGQQVEPCSTTEANDAIAVGEQVLVREVILYCDDIPQVFARSLLPLKSLTGEEQHLANLGEQPLGQVIFSSPHLERRAIEVASFDQHSNLSRLISALKLPHLMPCWGRRSLFYLHQKPLLVAEVFLPNAFAYQTNTHLTSTHQNTGDC